MAEQTTQLNPVDAQKLDPNMKL
ncbi:MAG: hypothetical protein K0R28_1694, partial [Paenibacillus sp.]|nr:hypothetical protein [Paenibacillus sp.]